MAMFFNSRRPRPFHHTFIYYDERKDRLRQLEEHARQELEAQRPAEEKERAATAHDDEASLRRFRAEALRGTFLAPDSRVRRRQGRLLSGNALLIVLILLCVVLFLLML